MGDPALRCSPMLDDMVLPAAIDEDTNIGNLTCLPVVGNTIGGWGLVTMATCKTDSTILVVLFIYIVFGAY